MQILECKTILFGEDMTRQNGLGVLYLGDSTPKFPWKPFYRIPWSDITPKKLTACNIIFTLNPDIRVDFDCKDRKICNAKFLSQCIELKNKGMLTHMTAVYEYGEKGKEHGKLHYHGIVKVADRSLWEKEVLSIFNKRSQVSHRTLNTTLIKSTDDRDRYLKYMKKEAQNKVKTLISF
jgi:hypothetical protein